MELKIIDKKIELLRELKGEIIKMWVDSETIKGIFKKYRIDCALFENHFATRIFDYFLGAIDGSLSSGRCPAVGVMLKFFYKKNITLSEVYLVCDNFKKSVILAFMERGGIESDLIEDIFHLFGLNFSGVIDEFLEENYRIENKIAPQKIEIKEAKNSETTPKIAIDPAIVEDIEEYFDKYSEMYYFSSISEGELSDFAKNMARLGEKLKIFGANRVGSAFVELSFAFLDSMNYMIQNWGKFTALLEALDNDVRIWKSSVSSGENLSNIEESIIANIEQIKSHLGQSDSDNDLELF